MVEFDLQIYNFRTNLNVDYTAQKGINLQSTFLAPPPILMTEAPLAPALHSNILVLGDHQTCNLATDLKYKGRVSEHNEVGFGKAQFPLCPSQVHPQNKCYQ